MKRWSIVGILLLDIICAVSASGGGHDSRGLRLAGSSTILPLAEAVGRLYQEKYRAPVNIRGGGTMAGIESVLSGSADIGLVSRALRDDEKSRLGYATIGHDAVVIIVNNNNPIREIRRDALIALYSGKVRNWREFGGRDEPVLLVSKLPGRSTLEIFEEYTGLRHPARAEKGANGPISGSSYEIGSNLEGATLVGGLPGAIGYVSVGTALNLIDKGMPLKVLPVKGIEGTSEDVMSGRYPVRRELNCVFRKDSGKVMRFIELFLSPEGQHVLSEHGFIPARKETRHETFGKD